MAPESGKQLSGQNWLRAAFERTKLPRNGLADYLELDYASVSRMLTGHRLLDPTELALARGYFSIVPDGLPPRTLEAIGLLRSAKTRRFAASEILRWFSTRAMRDPLARSFGRLIEDRTAGQTLRSDQIVAICRIENLDPVPLTAGYGISHFLWPEPGRPLAGHDAAEVIAAAASEWGKREHLHLYQFDRGRRSRPVGARKTPRTQTVHIEALASPIKEFESCAAYAVLESSKLPLLSAREVYLAPRGTEVRNGDAVAILRLDDGDALFGKLSLSTKTKVVIELADGKLAEIDTDERVELRRVAFCRA